MDKMLKIGKLYRSFLVERAAINKDKRTVDLAFSSETPVERWFGYEVLDHKKKAVDMSRLHRGGALLIDHDMRNQVGVIEEAFVGEDRVGRATVRFGRSAKAEEIFQDVVDGIRSNVSVGYQIDEMVLESESKDGPSTYRATRWTPYEISLVAVPADINVGVGRSDDNGKEIIIQTKQEETREMETTKAEPTVPAAPAVTVAPPTANPLEMEKARKRGIENLCKANNIPDNMRDYWIGGGIGMEQVSDDLLKIIEERGKMNPQSASKLGLTEKETKRFSLQRAIVAAVEKDWGNAGFELECSRTIANKLGQVNNPNRFYVPLEVQDRPVGMQRDMTTGDNGGGYLVETSNQGFIEMLRNRSVVMRMGARRLTGLTGSVTIPRQSAAGTGYWLATQATSITESNQTLVQVSLTPRNVGAYTEISRQLLLQSSPGIEGIVTNDLANVVAIAADLGALNGSGTEQPTGIIQTSNILTIASGTSFDYADILEFQSDVAAYNVIPVRGGYVTTPALAALCMARNKVTNDYSPLWEGNLWDGRMVGYPAMSSAQMPAGDMLFGDWNDVILAEWGNLAIDVNPYANFQAGIIGVRAMYSMDAVLTRPFAFSLMTSGT